MADQQNQFERFKHNDDYVTRLPSPPAIDIPPPTGNPIQGWNQAKNEYNFLEGFSFSDLQHDNDVVNSWSFTDRRDAQKILPFLYLGPIGCSRNEHFLKQAGITKIFAIPHLKGSSNVPPSGPLRLGAAEELGVEIQNTPLADSQRLVGAFAQLIESMNSHLTERKFMTQRSNDPEARGKILVCCQTGNDKSAALVVAYLMQTLHLTLEEAAQLVNTQRFSIDLNHSLKTVLQAYEGILRARRAVDQHGSDFQLSHQDNGQSTDLSGAPQVSKRGYDESDSTDVDMDYEPPDMSRFQNRTFSPFG